MSTRVLVALGRPAAGRARRSSGPCSTPPRRRAPAFVVSGLRRRTRPNPVLVRRSAFALGRGDRATAGSGRSWRLTPSWSGGPGRRQRRQSRTWTRRPTCSGDRGGLGRRASAPTASRSSASAKSPTAPTSTRPVNSLFRADPTRTDDPVLDALLRARAIRRHVARRRRGRRPVRAADRAGARAIGRRGHRRSIRRRRCSTALREIAEDYAIENVRTVERAGRRRIRPRRRSRPTSRSSRTSATTSRRSARSSTASRRRRVALCVAVLMERLPSRSRTRSGRPSTASQRVALPALPEVLELLRARGRAPSVERLAVEPRRFALARRAGRFRPAAALGRGGARRRSALPRGARAVARDRRRGACRPGRPATAACRHRDLGAHGRGLMEARA